STEGECCIMPHLCLPLCSLYWDLHWTVSFSGCIVITDAGSTCLQSTRCFASSICSWPAYYFINGGKDIIQSLYLSVWQFICQGSWRICFYHRHRFGKSLWQSF